MGSSPFPSIRLRHPRIKQVPVSVFPRSGILSLGLGLVIHDARVRLTDRVHLGTDQLPFFEDQFLVLEIGPRVGKQGIENVDLDVVRVRDEGGLEVLRDFAQAMGEERFLSFCL